MKSAVVALVGVVAATGCSSSSSSASGDDASDAATFADGSMTSGDGGDSGATSHDAATVSDAHIDSSTPPRDGAAPDSSPPSEGGTTSGQWVMGYYVGYDMDAYPIASIDWTGLTHIIFSPLTVNGNQSLDTSFDVSTGSGTATAMALSTAAHANGVKALLMLGGAGNGANIAAAATSGNRAAFVTALVSTMTSLGYDGIDLDWEDSVNLADLVALAQALRAAHPSMLISYPGGPIDSNFQTVDPMMATLAESLDMFNLQTYSPATTLAGSGWDSWFSSPLNGESGSTPIAIDDSFMRYVAAGVPKSKLGMGISFYAICYTGGITGPRQPTNGTSQTIVGGDNNYPLSKFFAAGSTFASSTSGEQQRDSVAQEPFLALTSAVNDTGCGSSTRYIAYEDETSIAAKGAYSKANGYGGIIIWQIEEGWLPTGATGGRAQNSLMQALKTGFIDP
jgi:chitinase